jgi:hypothetical protein
MACRFDLQKAVVIPMLEYQNIDHTIASTMGKSIKPTKPTQLTNQLRQFLIQGSSNHVRIHAAYNREHDYYNSLYSIEVVHIPHKL